MDSVTLSESTWQSDKYVNGQTGQL